MISIFVSVMNRNCRMTETLHNWLKSNWFDEIIVVDWSSITPFVFNDPKVKIYRVEGESTWILTHAYNLAASLTTGETIVKMDADYRIDKKFGNIFPIPKGTYYHGNWLGEWSISLALGNPVDNNHQYLNGFMSCYKQDFQSVNGYNERIVSYGWDDTDLYLRLNKNLTPLLISPETGIWHEPHSDELRVVNQNPGTTPNEKWEINKKISELNPWTPLDERQKWHCEKGVYTRISKE